MRLAITTLLLFYTFLVLAETIYVLSKTGSDLVDQVLGFPSSDSGMVRLRNVMIIFLSNNGLLVRVHERCLPCLIHPFQMIVGNGMRLIPYAQDSLQHPLSVQSSSWDVPGISGVIGSSG